MAIVSLGNYLSNFFNEEKKSLLANYPGLTLHRLKQDLKLHAFLNGIDSEEIFDFPYLPHRSYPLTLFFSKLKEGVPLQYITGQAYFYRSHFKVSKDVLIPRSETEILVELALQEIQTHYKGKNCRVLDVGTGSGVIALTLMMESRIQLIMTASDLCESALTVARENYFNHFYAINSHHQFKLIKSDRLKSVDGEFDLIVSNPPYIKSLADRDDVHSQVLRYEPHLALFIEDDLYNIWFEHFLREIYEKISERGMSLIEGHENHLEHLKQLALGVGFKQAIVIKDYTERNRFLQLRKN